MSLAALFFFTAHAGFQYLSASNVSIVWLPSGAALGWLLRFGSKSWPGIAVGSFLFSLSVGSPWWVSAGTAGSNTLEALAGWWLVRRHFVESWPFASRAALMQFLGSTAGLATLVGACTALPFAAYGEDWNLWGYLAGWLSWWLGDALGVVLLAPLTLALTEGPFRLSRCKWTEATVLVAWVAASAALVPLLQRLQVEPLVPLAFLLLPPLAWAALNFGTRGTSIILFLCASVFLWDASHSENGVLASWALNLALLIISLTTLLIMAITNEHRLAEENIRRINASLEQRVRERTAQLTAANQEMQAFTYSVSHDLRAPLRHIAGFTGILENNPAVTADPDAARHLAVVSDAARRMGQLIDDLLEFSRMGRAEMKRDRVDMRALIDEVRADLRTETAGRNIQWRVGPMPRVLGDAAMLRQVWANLLGNAVKYTRQQPAPRIEVGCREENGEWVFSVKDNGAGFDMQYAGKLFGVFQRLHREEEFEGTGIGLANVRRIVHRHGGTTRAAGVLNEGATFSFSLPRQPPKPEPEANG